MDSFALQAAQTADEVINVQEHTETQQNKGGSQCYIPCSPSLDPVRVLPRVYAQSADMNDTMTSL